MKIPIVCYVENTHILTQSFRFAPYDVGGQIFEFDPYPRKLKSLMIFTKKNVFTLTMWGARFGPPTLPLGKCKNIFFLQNFQKIDSLYPKKQKVKSGPPKAPRKLIKFLISP